MRVDDRSRATAADLSRAEPCETAPVHELPPPPADAVDCGTSTVWLANGIVYFQMRVQGRWELEDSERAMAAIRRVSAGKRLPVIIGAGLFTSASTDARRFWGRADGGERGAAMAVVVSSPVASMIVNLFMRLVPMEYPARVFASLMDAQHWVATTTSSSNAMPPAPFSP
jgi:hypothetical protein